MTTPSDNDADFMRQALAQGRLALPACLPNPPVGCVLVRNGQVVASGFTQAPYQDHAEAQALRGIAGPASEVCAYVTLEPCSFHGRTPSCARLLVQRSIARVVVAILDPDPRNNGAGLEILRQAGIRVRLGVLAAQAHAELDPYLGKSAADSRSVRP